MKDYILIIVILINLSCSKNENSNVRMFHEEIYQSSYDSTNYIVKLKSGDIVAIGSEGFMVTNKFSKTNSSLTYVSIDGDTLCLAETNTNDIFVSINNSDSVKFRLEPYERYAFELDQALLLDNFFGVWELDSLSIKKSSKNITHVVLFPQKIFSFRNEDIIEDLAFGQFVVKGDSITSKNNKDNWFAFVSEGKLIYEEDSLKLSFVKSNALGEPLEINLYSNNTIKIDGYEQSVKGLQLKFNSYILKHKFNSEIIFQIEDGVNYEFYSMVKQLLKLEEKELKDILKDSPLKINENKFMNDSIIDLLYEISYSSKSIFDH